MACAYFLKRAHAEYFSNHENPRPHQILKELQWHGDKHLLARYERDSTYTDFSWEPPRACNFWRGRTRSGEVWTKLTALRERKTADEDTSIDLGQPGLTSSQLLITSDTVSKDAKEIVPHEEQSTVEATAGKDGTTVKTAMADAATQTINPGSKRSSPDAESSSSKRRKSHAVTNPPYQILFNEPPVDQSAQAPAPITSTRVRQDFPDLHAENEDGVSTDIPTAYFEQPQVDKVHEAVLPIVLDDRRKWGRDAQLAKGRGSASIHRWKLLDQNNQLIESMVMKDVKIRFEDWGKISTWNSDARDVPTEVAVHRMLTARALRSAEGSDYIIKYKGFHLNRKLHTFRVAMEEAELGDLYRLVLSFHPDAVGPNAQEQWFGAASSGARYRQKESGIADLMRWEAELPPKLFLWELFGALVAASKFMHENKCIHRDLKPLNYLVKIDNHGSSRMQGWGIKILVCDFGSALCTATERYENPEDFDTPTTQRYLAPEMLRCHGPEYPSAKPVFEDLKRPGRGYPEDEKVDVYMLGLIMDEVIHGETFKVRGFHGPVWDAARLNNNWNPMYSTRQGLRVEDSKADQDAINMHYEQRKLLGYYPRYIDRWPAENPDKNSQDDPMIKLLKECLRFDPKNRPTLEHMSQTITLNVERLRNANLDENDEKAAAVDEVEQYPRRTWFQHLKTWVDINESLPLGAGQAVQSATQPYYGQPYAGHWPGLEPEFAPDPRFF